MKQRGIRDAGNEEKEKNKAQLLKTSMILLVPLSHAHENFVNLFIMILIHGYIIILSNNHNLM